MTTVQWLEDVILNMVYNGADLGEDYPALMEHVKKTKELEKLQTIKTVIHSLDEDGHTGDWKIKFANDYYNKISQPIL